MNDKKTQMRDKRIEAKLERKTVRWLMVIYDTLLYFACWFVVFILHPSMAYMPPMSTSGLYLVLGFVLFFGRRAVLKSYKKIWRYGSMHAFSREI